LLRTVAEAEDIVEAGSAVLNSAESSQTLAKRTASQCVAFDGRGSRTMASATVISPTTLGIVALPGALAAFRIIDIAAGRITTIYNICYALGRGAAHYWIAVLGRARRNGNQWEAADGADKG
jgi:hypothetical protein